MPLTLPLDLPSFCFDESLFIFQSSVSDLNTTARTFSRSVTKLASDMTAVDLSSYRDQHFKVRTNNFLSSFLIFKHGLM